MAAQEIGSLFVSLALETASFSAELKKTAAELKEFGEKANNSLASLANGLKGLAAGAVALGVKEAIDKFNEWTKSMAEAGEKAVNLGRALGIPLAQLVQLQGIMALAGESVQGASTAILHMNKAVSDASVNAGPMRENFKAIGVSLEELKTAGQDPIAMLRLLAERFNAYQDSAAKSAVFATIFGKSIQEVTALLGGGADQIDEFSRRQAELDPSATAAAAAGAKLADAFNESKVAMKGLMDEVFVALAPMLITAANNATAFAEKLQAIGAAASAILAPLTAVMNVLGAIDKATSSFENFKKSLGLGGTPGDTNQILRDRANQDKGIGVNGPLIDRGFIAERPTFAVKPQVVPPVTRGGGGGGGGGGGPSQVQLWRDELDEMLISQRKFFDDDKKDELKFWEEKLKLTAEGTKEYVQVRKIIFELEKTMAHQTRDDLIKRAETDITINDERFKRNEQAIKHLVDIDQLSKTQGIDAEKALTEQKWALDQQYYEKKRAAAEGDTRTLATLADKQKEDYEKHVTALEKLDQDKEKARFDQLKQVGQDIAGAFETAFSNAFDAIGNHTFKLRDLMSSLLKDIGKALASRAFKSLIGGDSGEGGGLMGTLLGKLFGIGGSGNLADADVAALATAPGMASGGSFAVGGSGAIDSKIIAFRATPGELVQVTPGSQSGGGGGGADIIHINLNPSEGWVAGIADQRVITRSGQIVDIAVKQSSRTVQRNFAGMSAEAQARQL